MKRLVAIAIGLGLAFSAMAQGTVTFKNTNFDNDPQNLHPRTPIYEVDGTTKLDGTGGAYLADLYYAAVGSTSFTSLGLAQPFLTGSGAGYFNASDVAIPGFASGTQVQIQVRAWRAADGATWAIASAKDGAHVTGANGAAIRTVTVTAGGAGSPPLVPGSFYGDQVSHSLGIVVAVPEPSTILLGLAGLAGLVALRRKN